MNNKKNDEGEEEEKLFNIYIALDFTNCLQFFHHSCWCCSNYNKIVYIVQCGGQYQPVFQYGGQYEPVFHPAPPLRGKHSSEA